MLTTLTIATGLPVAVLGLWLLAETVRSGRSRWWLALALPVLLAWPVGTYVYGSRLLGYATPDEIRGEFALIHAFADEQQHAVYALVRINGGEPRLYKITSGYERARKTFAAAQVQVGKGVPMTGKMRRAGIADDGEFVFYVLPPSGLPDKNAPTP